jgi:hypothetical protein
MGTTVDEVESLEICFPGTVTLQLPVVNHRTFELVVKSLTIVLNKGKTVPRVHQRGVSGLLRISVLA